MFSHWKIRRSYLITHAYNEKNIQLILLARHKMRKTFSTKKISKYLYKIIDMVKNQSASVCLLSLLLCPSTWLSGRLFQRKKAPCFQDHTHIAPGRHADRAGWELTKAAFSAPSSYISQTAIGLLCEGDAPLYPSRQTPTHPSCCGTSKKTN